MKYLPTALVALIVGTAVFLFQNNRIKELEEKVAESSPRKAVESSKSRPKSSPQPVSSSPVAQSDQHRKLSESDRKTLALPEPGNSLADVMQSEAGRAMIKQGIEAGIPMMYGDFIDSLDLDEEESKYFKGLLTQRMLDQQQLGMKWMSADGEEKEAIALAMEKSRKDSSVKIDEFLQSEEDSATFKKYEQQLPERQQMQGIRNSLANEPLTPEVEERLVDTLYQARLNSGEGNGSDEENWQQLGETGDFSLIENRWKATDEEIAKNIPNILTPTQTETFLNHWKTARTMQTAQYKMGMEMMGITKK